MLSRQTQKFKVISANSAFDFETRLNSFIESLDKQGIEYEVQTDPKAGFLAFIIYRESVAVPETVKEEYQAVGELHSCIECPFFVRPVDGRRKYTRCEKAGMLTHGGKPCCEIFYELLDRNEIKLVEVG